MDILLRRRPVSVPVLPIVTGVLLALFLLLTVRVGRIQGSEIGVFVNNLTGSIAVETQPGAHVFNGLMTDFYTLDNTMQTLRMLSGQSGIDDVNIKTEDGSDVSLDVELNFRLIQDPEVIRKAVVPECGLGNVALARRSGREIVDAYKMKWIRDYARSVIRYVFGELKTDEFYQAAERDKKARQAEDELNALLNKHGIRVDKVVPDRFRFYEEYERKIAEKKAADQEVQSQMELARAALESQKRKEVEAHAIATVAIETMKGQLQKELLAAEAEAERERLGAEAYAVTTRTAAEAELYRAQNEAKSALARATAEAEGLRQLAGSLAGHGAANLVKIEYAKALQSAVIDGLPYATDPRIQKVEVTGADTRAPTTAPASAQTPSGEATPAAGGAR